MLNDGLVRWGGLSLLGLGCLGLAQWARGRARELQRQLEGEGALNLGEVEQKMQLLGRESPATWVERNVLIAARITAEDPVQLTLSPEGPALLSEVTRHRYFEGSSVDPEPVYRSTQVARGLLLTDAAEDKSLPLHAGLAPQLRALAQPHAVRLHTHSLPAHLRLLARFLNSIVAFGEGLLRVRLSGFEVGLLEREVQVALHTPFFLYATVLYNRESHSLHVVGVKALVRSLDELRSALSREVWAARLAALALGTLTALATTRFLLLLARRVKLRRKVGNLTRYFFAAKDLHCAVCRTELRNVVALPCRHASHCAACYARAATAQPVLCTVCGQSVREVHRFFFA